MGKEKEEVAIVIYAGIGMEDRCSDPVLRIGIKMLQGECQIRFSGIAGLEIIKESKCPDLQALKGKGCVIVGGGIGETAKFVRWLT